MCLLVERRETYCSALRDTAADQEHFYHFHTLLHQTNLFPCRELNSGHLGENILTAGPCGTTEMSLFSTTTTKQVICHISKMTYF